MNETSVHAGPDVLALAITAEALERVFAAARESDGVECLGVLASPAGSGAITEARRLGAIASSARAEASPAAIAGCAGELRAGGLVPRGIFHSHPGGVFHSQTDDGTIDRVLPAMASWGFQASPAAEIAPTVTGPDEAVLPLPDGQVLTFALLGPDIPELDGVEPAMWSSTLTTFEQSPRVAEAALDGSGLSLVAGNVRIRLGIPEGASITCHLKPAPARVARTYSLVVNSRGDTDARCLVVYELNGLSLVRRQRCDVEIVGGASPGPGRFDAGEVRRPQAGRVISEAIACLGLGRKREG